MGKMQELSLMKDLLRKVEAVAQEQGGRKVLSVGSGWGRLRTSPAYFCEHFVRAAQSTVAEGARLETEVMNEITDPDAHEILLDSVEVED